MQQKTSLLLSLLIIGVGVAFVGLNKNSSLKSIQPIREVANVIQIAEATSTIPLPVPSKKIALVKNKLQIPSIGVDANIESLGLTSAGAMDSPVGPNDVGWYSLGPKPGTVGSAVMDGHFGWKNKIPAVFDNLSKLKKGDKILVIDENGIKTTFIVRELRVLANNADATAVFTSTDGKSHLNLITCNGQWDVATKNRPNRLIVFADKAV
jgi:LPXTG-site transpeptidase (sortase) family protein